MFVRSGYRIIPVNPQYDNILGEPCRKSLADIPEKVDIVDCFRRSEEIPAIAEEAIATSGVSQQSGGEGACEPSDDCRAKLEECDARYYANDERVELRLFAFIEAHQHELRIP